MKYKFNIQTQEIKTCAPQDSRIGGSLQLFCALSHKMHYVPAAELILLNKTGWVIHRCKLMTGLVLYKWASDVRFIERTGMLKNRLYPVIKTMQNINPNEASIAAGSDCQVIYR